MTPSVPPEPRSNDPHAPVRGIALGPARQGESQALARMSRRLIEAGLPWRWTPRALAAQLGDPETEVVVARRDGRPVGFAVMQYRFVQRSAHLVLLAVEPEERRAGIGGALLDWLEAMAHLGGIDEICVELRWDNTLARAFYVGRSFVEVGRIRGYYDGRIDARSMKRHLNRKP